MAEAHRKAAKEREARKRREQRAAAREQAQAAEPENQEGQAPPDDRERAAGAVLVVVFRDRRGRLEVEPVLQGDVRLAEAPAALELALDASRDKLRLPPAA
jgi:hypothetical protein